MKNNRVYIASKVGPMESSVKDLRDELERRGYEIVYDWTTLPILKPFEEHIDQATEAAEAMARAVMECDILIVLFADAGIGFHIETGGALVASIIQTFIGGEQKQKRIYVVGEGSGRSVFYFHKSVQRLPDVIALLEELPQV